MSFRKTADAATREESLAEQQESAATGLLTLAYSRFFC